MSRFCLLAFASLFLSSVTQAGQFEFSDDVIAGPPGGTTAPVLTVGFRGDGETVDALIDVLYDASRFTAVVQPRSNALCIVSSGRIRIISPGSISPLTTDLVPWCDLRFNINAQTPQGAHDLIVDSESVECASLEGPVTPCTAPSGDDIIRVGAVTPIANLDYIPALSEIVLLPDSSAEITAEFIPGGFGANIELRNCAIEGGAGNFQLVGIAPSPFSFGSNKPDSGLIELSCTAQEAVTTAMLRCVESRNNGSERNVAWTLQCPALPPNLMFQDGFEPE